MKAARANPPQEVRCQAVFRLWLANLLFSILLGANYLWHVTELETPKAWFFALPALLSTALMLTILPGSLFWLGARFVAKPRTLGWVQGAFWTVFQVLLFADTRIFNMFRYHMNGQVLNLVAVRGSEDAIHLGWQVWTAIAVGLATLIALNTWFWRHSLERAARVLLEGGPSALIRPWFLALLLVPAVFVEKTIYAQADLVRDNEITHLARLFPLYARLPMEEVVTAFGGENDIPRPVELNGFALDYPHARPAILEDGPRPNVVVLMIDCLRADRLAPEHMPKVTPFAEECRRFENHVSGGNSTRFGIFSLMYGLHGSYWFPVLEEERSPVLVDTLLELGYEFGVFGSASMGYPEMRSTVWSSVTADVHDDFVAPEAWQRDELAADAMIRWLDSVDGGEEPYFGFLLLDSPHQTYSFPPDQTPFVPAAPDLDYLTMTRNEGPTPEQLVAVRNRYDNAVYHADDVLGRVLDALRASKDYENTVVVVTGDHGEEFLECGFFGHTSAFTSEQVSVPFLMRGPGIEPGRETGPTSHLDFAPTVLEMLGANPSGRDSWTLGENLFAPVPDRRRVLSGWDELGVWVSHLGDKKEG